MTELVRPDPGYDWRCQRCNWQWRSRTPNAPAPKQCARCRSAYWTVPKRGKNDAKPDRTRPAAPAPEPDNGHLSLLRPPPVMYTPPEPTRVVEVATWPEDEPESSQSEEENGQETETPES